MHTIKAVGLVLAVSVVGLMEPPSAGARPFFGVHPGESARLAQKEAILRHNAEKQAILGGWAGHPMRPPLPPPAYHRIPVASYRHPAPHQCVTVTQQVWAPGRYERVTEYRPVGCAYGRHHGGVVRTEPVIVMRWVPGHYESVLVQDPGCSCRGPVCDSRPHPGAPWQPRYR